MNAQEFAKGIFARWPTQQAELVADLTRLGDKYSSRDLDRLMEKVVELHDGKFIPRYAEVKHIAELSGIHPKETPSVTGYSKSLGGYVAFRCRHCGLMVPVGTSGPLCRGCGGRRQGETAVVSHQPWDFSDFYALRAEEHA